MLGQSSINTPVAIAYPVTRTNSKKKKDLSFLFISAGSPQHGQSERDNHFFLFFIIPCSFYSPERERERRKILHDRGKHKKKRKKFYFFQDCFSRVFFLSFNERKREKDKSEEEEEENRD
jgi:hypothetical protein